MPTRSINALRLFARRAIALSPSLTTSSAIPVYRDPASPSQAIDRSGSRRWLTQDARRDGPRYRNRTKHFKQKREKADAVPSAEIDESTVSFAPEELVPGRPMLERILKDIKETGTTFILPTGEEAIQEVLEPFRRLHSIGVKPDYVVRSCIAHPQLFKLLVSKCQDTITALSTLVEICQLSYEDALRLISSYPEVLADGVEQIQLALDALIVNGVPAGRNLGSLVKRCPPLLFARAPEELKKGVQGLADFFSRKQISMIIQRCPDVLLKNIQETEEKYEYIFYQMGLEGEQFTDCAKWGSMSLEEIIQRHEFLVKCGRFRTPDPKHPQLKMENPSLRSILDTNDEHFASQVAQVTLEEWIIYQSLRVKENEMAIREHSFVRVKPSMRKAYERRRKDAVDVPEHVFDVSANSGL